jgi:hypothetical protein
MKRLILLSFALVTTVLLSGATSDSCDVEAVYQELESNNLVALSRSGDLTEIDVLLQKSYLNSGTYKVSLQRVGANLYKINSGSTYIKTRFCYKYGFTDAILTINGMIFPPIS